MGFNYNNLQCWCATTDVMIRIKLTHTMREYVKPRIGRVGYESLYHCLKLKQSLK